MDIVISTEKELVNLLESSELGDTPYNAVRLNMHNLNISDGQFRSVLALLLKNPQIACKLQALVLSNSSTKIIDLTSFTSTLDNINLHRNSELRVIVLGDNPRKNLRLYLGFTDLTIANCIAINLILNQHRSSAEAYVSLKRYRYEYCAGNLLTMKLPAITLEMLEEHFSYIMDQYKDVTELKTKAVILANAGFSLLPASIVGKIMQYSDTDRSAELYTLLYNNVKMFMRAFPVGSRDRLILDTYLSIKHLSIGKLEKSKDRSDINRFEVMFYAMQSIAKHRSSGKSTYVPYPPALPGLQLSKTIKSGLGIANTADQIQAPKRLKLTLDN